jgi:gluconolactonase
MSSTGAIPQEAVGLDQLEVVAEGLDHPEGIAITADGRIYVGGESGQIYLIDGDDAREVANVGGFALGIAADGDGRLYVCSDALGSVLLVDPVSGVVEPFATGIDGRPMKTPNFPAFDAAGTLYVSDSGGWQLRDGLIWAVRPGRRVEVFSQESVDFPNGVAVAPDGSRLYVAESSPGAIVEIPIAQDGTAGPRRVLCELGIAVPDGLAVAADGSLVVAFYRPDVICRWSGEGGLEVLAADPQGQVLNAPTNIAFTGDDRDVAVVPNLGGWHLTRGRLGVRGAPLELPPADVIEG